MGLLMLALLLPFPFPVDETPSRSSGTLSTMSAFEEYCLLSLAFALALTVPVDLWTERLGYNCDAEYLAAPTETPF